MTTGHARRFTLRRAGLAGLAAAVMIAPTLAEAQTGSSAGSPLSIELNKLEPHDATCRLLFVVNNRSDKAYQTLKLDVIVFGMTV